MSEEIQRKIEALEQRLAAAGLGPGAGLSVASTESSAPRQTLDDDRGIESRPSRTWRPF